MGLFLWMQGHLSRRNFNVVSNASKRPEVDNEKVLCNKTKNEREKIQVDTGIKEKKFYISEKNLNKSLKAKSFIFSSLKCDVSKNKYDGNLSNASK